MIQWNQSTSAPEHYQAQMIIVIHPGSLNIRIGRASDLNPITMLHAVGRKRKPNGTAYRDRLLPEIDSDSMEEFEEQRLLVSHTIQKLLEVHSDGPKRRRIVTPPQQISTFNRRSTPEEFPLDPSELSAKLEEKPESIFDEDILTCSQEDYNVHFPFRRGQLNLHQGIGGSMSAVLTDLQEIWSHILRSKLNIDTSTLSKYSAVLVVSDIYNRSHLKELISLLLVRMQFKSCFLLQDHVASTFGAGLGYGCVVDLGDQKCSISCVEDGISQPDTRVRLEYGGADVTQVFQTLLKKCSFPYKECDCNNYGDAFLLTQLKERYCHINLDVCGAQENSFEVRKGDKRLVYTLQLGDECILAPLALLHTELMNITGKSKTAKVQTRSCNQTDTEDCFDAEYIRETGRRNGKDQMIEGVVPITGEVGDEDFVVVDTFESERETNIKATDKDDLIFVNNGQIMSLDQAIVRSIERCSSDEMKRKMYGCILIVGGGAKISGFVKFLENKVALQMRSITSQRASDNFPQQLEVAMYTKDMDSSMIAWKGAAIMSCLESASELWIFQKEWNSGGLRILREKAPFIW